MTIIFLPSQKEIEPDSNLSLLQLARKAGVALEATCGGKRICGKCKVIVTSSDGPLPTPSDRERDVLGELIEEGYRLACETVLTRGAMVVIPEESRGRRQVILTSDTRRPYPVRLRPSVRTCYVEVPPPALEAVLADRERLNLALKTTYNIRPPDMGPEVLRRLPRALRSDAKGLTVVLRDNSEIIDLFPGRQEDVYGVAFDVGTTTIVAFLLDLTTGEKCAVVPAMNPQIDMGDDVISRIAFCQEQVNGLEKLRTSIVDGLNALVETASAEARIIPRQIVDLTVVGNTAMHHLLVGLDPRYLSMAPYPPVVQGGETWKAAELGLRIGPSACAHLLPLKAGFVGSDTIACILATGLHRRKTPALLIDLGTNGEIVFGNRDRMLCCSTAAGPAFEGGHIRWGMRAAAGAIERVRIDADTLHVEWQTIEQEKPVGLCGSGIISAVAEMIRSGIILGRGNMNDDLESSRLRQGQDGWEFVLSWASETAVAQDIVITQKDVAELQMAKAAVYAGAALLIEQYGEPAVKEILLAGACGNYVDPQDACAIDLFPGCLHAAVKGVGNAAGHGACLALLNKRKRQEAGRIARQVEYCELAAAPRFQELFISSMFFTSARDFEDDY